MAYFPLGDSEETHVIFDGRFPEHLATLSASEQRDLLTKLSTIANEDASPDGYIYETIGNIDIIRFSDAGRVYTKVITYVPEGNTKYHIIYVLYVDEDHEYDRGKLGKFSQQAQQTLDEITDLSSVADVEAYLEDHDSLTVADLETLLNE